MNKLKNKIFWTIFILLTSFIIIILFIFNYQNYYQEYQKIKTNLTRINNDINIQLPVTHNDNNIKKETLEQKIFIDSIVYTVLLDNENNIIDIISHSEDNLNEEKIFQIAQKIIKKHSNNDIKISNLYISNYSYYIKNNSYLTIIDNKNVKEKLLSILLTSLLLLIVSEIIIVILSNKLTNWLIKPVELSFTKQKQFIADASHELKTPLAVIMASTEALESEPTEQKWLKNIKNETNRMNNLITKLLDLAKLETGISKKLYTSNDLSKIVTKTVLTFESLAFENNLSFEYNIEKNIKLNCNPEEIHQLIAILLDNAIKHSYEKEKIKITLNKTKNEINLSIINKGNPISECDAEKIFERFYRIDKSRNRTDNRYGLGLAIAKNIVLNHQGKIKAYSKDGFTTFKVVFKS